MGEMVRGFSIRYSKCRYGVLVSSNEKVTLTNWEESKVGGQNEHACKLRITLAMGRKMDVGLGEVSGVEFPDQDEFFKEGFRCS